MEFIDDLRHETVDKNSHCRHRAGSLGCSGHRTDCVREDEEAGPHLNLVQP